MSGMTQWDEIKCVSTDPHMHLTQDVVVNLAKRHGYHDYPPIPQRLQLSRFKMKVWDWRAGAQPGTGWCPARDVVSETISELGIWEPVETIAMLDLFKRTARADHYYEFIDIGAQIGWFSLLAALSGLTVHAVETDPDVRVLLEANLLSTECCDFVIDSARLGRDVLSLEDRGDDFRYIAKIDVEGAEWAAIEALAPIIDDGSLQAVLIELSPVFGVDTDKIVKRLMAAGFCAGFLPEKSMPPADFTGIDDMQFVAPGDVDWVSAQVAAVEQVNVLFAREAHGTIPPHLS